MGGELDHGPDYLEVLSFDTVSCEVKTWVDLSYRNPLQLISSKQTHKIFQISEEHNLFLLWMASSNSYKFQIFSSIVGGFEVVLEGKIYF